MIKFFEKEIEEDIFYVGEIVEWKQVDGKVRIVVALDEFPGETFIWARRISALRGSAFHTFCEGMGLVNHKEQLVLERLDKDEKVMAALNKMPDGRYLVREMYWESDWEENEDSYEYDADDFDE